MFFLLECWKDCFKKRQDSDYTLKKLREIFDEEEYEEKRRIEYARTYAFRRNRQVPNVDTSGSGYYRIR